MLKLHVRVGLPVPTDDIHDDLSNGQELSKKRESSSLIVPLSQHV